MSTVKSQLEALLWDIYGRQRHRIKKHRCKRSRYGFPCLRLSLITPSYQSDIRKLRDMNTLLKDEIRLMSCFLQQALTEREQNRWHQQRLCEYVDALLHSVVREESDDVHPKMRFSLTPPPPKAIHSSTITTAASTPRWNSRNCSSAAAYQPNNNNNYNHSSSHSCNGDSGNDGNSSSNNCDKYNKMQRQEDTTNSNKPNSTQSEEESTSDYKQWLHAMKLVARLPGGIPPEFRRKLWLSLADKYLKSKNVDWAKEEEKCFCEKWREDDEELGIQIVKDLHRTGSTLCTGPAGDVNQAKLKRILLGYARYNPEVGYCQGFNMLGALILQVMDKEEIESMKVMIYLVEGILPPGYFCGSMGGLQADMAVFRELMQIKLPRLARHLQKLQGPVENAYEPPLTNVFTMQWFLTMFCTCLPMSCVLRVWDLVLIEGSDVLLRTALALWSLLEERVLSTRSADDFYGKMGSFSSELLNGHLIDSNGLIEKVVQLGPIQDIQKLRDKHLYSSMALKNKQGLNLYYDEDEPDMDEDSRLAVATVWGIPWGRRGSQGQTAATIAKQAVESKDRIALDISLLKKQYDRLRERQKQAHIILTTACSTARQSTATSAATIPVNQLLSGRPAIVTNRGRRTGPPPGAIPPARKPSLPAVLQDKPLEKQLRRGETLQWRDSALDPKRRRDSLTWKEIRAERAAMLSSGSIDGLKSQKIRTKRLGKSDSSSYSEESEEDEGNDKVASSSDTSLCDDDPNPPSKSARKYASKAVLMKQRKLGTGALDNGDRQRPKSWAPSNSDIPFVLMTTDSPNHSADESAAKGAHLPEAYAELSKEEENSATESDQNLPVKINGTTWHHSTPYSPLANEDLPLSKPESLLIHTELTSAAVVAPPTSSDVMHLTQPITDVVDILAISKALNPPSKTHLTESTNSLGSGDDAGDGEGEEKKPFGVSDEGVTNQYFERVNSTERPTKLELMYSLNEEDSIRDAYNDGAHNEDNVAVAQTSAQEEVIAKDNQSRRMDLLVDYSEKSSAACIAEAKTEISTTYQKNEKVNKAEHTSTFTSSAASKRRDPRRLTLTRSSTMDIEKRYQALEKRLSMEVSSKYKMGSSEDAEKRQYHHTEATPHSREKEEENQRESYRIPQPISSNEIHEGEKKYTSYATNSISHSRDAEQSQREHYRTPYSVASVETHNDANKYLTYHTNSIPRSKDNMEIQYEHNRIRQPDGANENHSDADKHRTHLHSKDEGGKTLHEPYRIPPAVSSKENHSDGSKYRTYHTNSISQSKDEEESQSEKLRISHSRVSSIENNNESDKYRYLHSRDAEGSQRESYRIPHPISSMENHNGTDKYRTFHSQHIPLSKEEEEGRPDPYRITHPVSSVYNKNSSDDERESSKPATYRNHRTSSSIYSKDNSEDERETTKLHRIPQTVSSMYTKTNSDDERETSKPAAYRNHRTISSMYTKTNSDDERETSDSTDIPVQRKHIIPSTADLEERFENMIRDRSKQVSEVYDSEKGGTSRKTPPSPKDSSRRDSARNVDKRPEQTNKNYNATSKNSGPQDDVSSKGMQSDRDSEGIDEQDNEEDDEDISDGKASYEKESLSKATKSNALQRKKEPPDTETDYSEKYSDVADNEDNAHESDEDRSVTVSGHDSPVEDSEPEMPEEEEEEEEEEVDEPIQTSRRQSDLMSSASRRQSEMSEHITAASRRQSEMAATSRRQSRNQDKEFDERSEISRKSSVAKRSPPSTEELEKRFDALEKQMSISRSEASEDLLEETAPRGRNLEYDDRQSPDGYSELDQQLNEEESQKSAGESETADEAYEDTARANRIKANVIEAMKSSPAHHDEDDEDASEGQRRSNKMATNVMEAMKSSIRRPDEQRPESRSSSSSRSNQMATSVMEAMRPSSGRDLTEDDSEGVSRANRIKANVIEAMKSSSALPSPAEDSDDPERSHKMAANVMQAMKKSKARHVEEDNEEEDFEIRRRSNKIKANIIESMKTSASTVPSPVEDSEATSRQSHSMAANVMKASMATNVVKAMKSSADRHHETDEVSGKSSRSNRIKAGVLEAMTSSSAHPSPQEEPETPSKSRKMASSVMDAMKSSTHHTTEDSEKRRRADRIKADVIEAMKSSDDHHSPVEDSDEPSRSSKMATNVMAAMKSSTRHSDGQEATEKRSRSDKIKAGIIASMKASPDEEPQTPSKSQRMASNVMDAMKSSGRSSEEPEKRSRSDKIKAGIIASMKASPDEEPQTPTRSDNIKAGIIASMKASPVEEPQSPSKSHRMASNVMDAMKSSARPSDEPEKRSRSDKIKAGIIASMKASPDEEPQTPTRSDKIKAGIIASMKASPVEEPQTPTRSDKIKAGIIASMKASPVEEPQTPTRSDKIKAGIIASMKASPVEEPQTPSKSQRMASNVMDAMRSSTRHSADDSEKRSRSDKMKAEVISAMKSSAEHHSPVEDSDAHSRSSKMATNVMAAMKSSSHRSSEQRDSEKTKRANKLKADVIEAMKSTSDHPELDEDSQSRRSNRMATNVMDAMKSSVHRSNVEKPSKVRHSPEEENGEKLKRSNKIKSDVIEAMKSSGRADKDAEDPNRSTKMATNVMETMKSRTTRRSAAEDAKHKSRHTTEETEDAEISSKASKISPKVAEATSTGRRSSEPPSTEDLEKRYEVFKRRMSSKNFETSKAARKQGSSNIDEGLDEHQATPKTSPPSTDSLERRFEKLQSESGKSKIEDKKKSTVKSPPKTEPASSKQSPNKKEKSPATKLPKDKVTETKSPTIEDDVAAASPMKQSPSQEPGSRSALIEELQSKMGNTPDGQNIKPSSINPNRKTPPHPPPPPLRKSKTDETSETHATNANSLSGKYEPLHSSSRKMVRRFSDLPSRADLENRLQFLEEQLSKTLLKQRRASDSEVASTSRNHRQIKPIPATIRHVGKLESRVQELEKQLSSSSKFKVTGKEQKSSENAEDLSASQMGLEITADSVNLTGKELVRYSHFGDVEEHGFQSPINISINIHMTLSKEDLGNAATQHLSRAEELSRRLVILEEQLKNSQRNIASTSTHPMESQEPAVAVSSEPVASTSQKAAEMEERAIRPSELPISLEMNKIDDRQIIEPTEAAEPVKDIAEEYETQETVPTAEIVSEIAEPEPQPAKQIAHTSPEVEESQPEPCAECIEEAPIEVPLEHVDKEVAKKPDKLTQGEDFDRRLLILEEHMKNSQTISTPEAQSIKSAISKEVMEDKAIVQSKSDVAKEVSEREGETKTIEQIANKIEDKPREENKRGLKVEENKAKSDIDVPNKAETTTESIASEEATTKDKPVGSLHGTQMVPVEVNKKTLVLLLDNEPKAVKVRRLTRANTEELEDLFQALEKQLIERGQVRPEDIAALKDSTKEAGTTKEMADLTKEIMQFSKSTKADEEVPVTKKTPHKEEEFDWGENPVKHHLKKKTVYLPSTRELESRFRSLERQIKMLEDVEKIDVEQRLTEIERKIKLQYSLSHEKDLNRFLDLCEGKGLDDTPVETPVAEPRECTHAHHCATHAKKHQSPVRMVEPEHLEYSHPCDHSHSHSTAAKKKHQSPVRVVESTQSSIKPTTEDLEYRFRALDLRKSSRTKPKEREPRREPIHPLEMLLDPSPEDIPTTGELEHRMKMLEEGRSTPSPTSRKSRSKSPARAEDSPSPSGLPTAKELEARLAALEKEQRFDFKMQKNYKEFNQKLKDIISPSLSFEEFRATRSSSAESAKKSIHRSPSPKVTVSGCTGDAATCPRTIRFHEDEEQQQRSKSRSDCESMVSTNNDAILILEENSNMIQRILKKTIADSHGGCSASITASMPAHLASSLQEGLGVMGIRLMRETSPLRRKGTHTGVPLRTGENINDQLTSIKNTIKSIDSLCEEKPYRTERCQQYIDSLCSDSTYFASKKSSYDDLRSRHNSRSRSRECGGPSIRISDQSSAYVRSMGSADSIRSSSPLRPTSPLQYHSNRDLRRETSPRRRRGDEEREENESRVRRDNLLPNSYYTYNHSSLSQSSHSLTKFHKVDSQLNSNDVDDIDVELQQTYRQATAATTTTTTFSSNETTSIHDSNTNTSNTANTNRTTLTSNVNPNSSSNTNDTTTTFMGSSSLLDRPMSPYRQLGLSRSNTPVYSPAKLEIRHTTVTSTFYDRVLAEKQLEKKHSTNTTTTTTNTTTTNVPANRSPLLEQPPVIRPTDKYSPPTFPYPETAAAVTTSSDTAADSNTAATTEGGTK